MYSSTNIVCVSVWRVCKHKRIRRGTVNHSPPFAERNCFGSPFRTVAVNAIVTPMPSVCFPKRSLIYFSCLLFKLPALTGVVNVKVISHATSLFPRLTHAVNSSCSLFKLIQAYSLFAVSLHPLLLSTHYLSSLTSGTTWPNLPQNSVQDWDVQSGALQPLRLQVILERHLPRQGATQP